MVPSKMMHSKKEDKISVLPNCILLDIISRLELSTKEVIKTTATISKRWQHLWTRLPTLVFTNEDLVNKGNSINVVTNYYSFIDKTLNQCPTDVNLKKLKLQISVGPTLQVNRWIRYAIMHNVQEIDLRITDQTKYALCDDELFFNNSCLISMKLSGCRFNPRNCAIRWDKLKCLCIDRWTLDEDLIGKILSGSPCLETLELTCCYFDGRIPMSLFRNFGVLEHLSCDLKTYERLISYYDELLGDESEFDDEWFGDETPISMKFLRGVFNPPNGAICWDKLKFLCIDGAELDEYSIGKILARSPCLDTFQLNDCCGFARIDVTSKSIKNLVLSYSGYSVLDAYTDTIEINAPYILSLTIKGDMYFEELSLENVSSLVKADLNYWISDHFTEELGRRNEEELLRGLLSRLGHVNEISLGNYCLQTLSGLEATGFQFRKGSDLHGIWPYHYRVFSLIQK